MNILFSPAAQADLWNECYYILEQDHLNYILACLYFD